MLLPTHNEPIWPITGHTRDRVLLRIVLHNGLGPPQSEAQRTHPLLCHIFFQPLAPAQTRVVTSSDDPTNPFPCGSSASSLLAATRIGSTLVSVASRPNIEAEPWLEHCQDRLHHPQSAPSSTTKRAMGSRLAGFARGGRPQASKHGQFRRLVTLGLRNAISAASGAGLYSLLRVHSERRIACAAADSWPHHPEASCR